MTSYGWNREPFGPHPKSIVTDEDLSDLRCVLGVSEDVRFALPRNTESPELVRDEFYCAYTTYFTDCGLTFPIQEFVLAIIARLGMAFPQMCPNFVRQVIGLSVRAREEGIVLSVRDIFRICEVKQTPGFKGSYYLSPRTNCGVLGGLPPRDNRWKEKYFFFEVNRATVRDFRKLSTSWVHVVDKPAKIKVDIAFRQLLQSLQKGSTHWTSFNSSRIRKAFDLIVLERFPIVPETEILAESSSAASSSAQLIMSKRTSFRSAPKEKASPNPVGPVRADDLTLASGGARETLPQCVSASDDKAACQALVVIPKDNRMPEPVRTVEKLVEPRPSSDDLVRKDRLRSSLKRSRGEVEVDPSREDKAYTTKPSSSSSSSTGKPPYYWEFVQKKDFPITSDPKGAATIVRHFKPAGCQVPV